MRKLFTRRSFRCVVCLILVCCLVVSWSPIRAHASALPEVAGVVTKVISLSPGAGAAAGGAALGVQVFWSVALGLGLICTTAVAIDLLNQYVEYSGELETSIYYYPDGSWSYGVDMGFVERVRAFLWDDGIISYLGPMTDSQHAEFLKISAYRYAVCWYSADTSYWNFYVADYPISVVWYDNWNKWIASVSESVGYYFYVDSAGNRSVSQKVSSYSIYGDWSSCGKEVVGPLCSALSQVAPLEVPIPEAYPEWNTNARPATNPDTDEEVTVLPIPFSPSADPETQIGTLTQPDIWQGSIAEPMPDTDTNPDTQPDSPGAPSSGIGDYQIDLKKFFPFCIPFDLYDFFACLNADPVAPVIEWVIPLPGGGTYPLEIDLSAFDDVAQLLRRLQLLLFCVGLAFKTRDLIKG